MVVAGLCVPPFLCVNCWEHNGAPVRIIESPQFTLGELLGVSLCSPMHHNSPRAPCDVLCHTPPFYSDFGVAAGEVID